MAIIITAIGVILYPLPPLVHIVSIRIGCPVLISQIIRLHGNGPAAMAPIPIGSSGATREEHGVTCMAAPNMAHGSMSITFSPALPMNGA